MARKKFFLTASIGIVSAIILLMVTSAATAEDKPYKIEISSLWPGTSVYANGILWAKLINENSKLVAAAAREGKGPNVDMKTIFAKPERRKHLIFFGIEGFWWAAQQGLPGWKPFVGKYDFNNIRHLALFGYAGDVMLTTNPNIKTMEDMEGKTFVASARDLHNAKAMGFMEAFKVAGVKPVYKTLGVGPMIASARDGLVDVIHAGILLTGPNKYVPSTYLTELFATKKVYSISLERKYIEAMKKKTGHPGLIIDFPPGSVNEYQTETVTGLGMPLMWSCDVSVPDEVVKDILQVYYDNIEKFGDLNPGAKVLTKKTIAAGDLPESRYHPAAVEFYKEKGVQLTSMQALGYAE